MTLKIQILDISDNIVHTGFYYPIPPSVKLVDSFDQPPLGVLTTDELALYNNGDLFEYDIKLTLPFIRRMIQREGFSSIREFLEEAHNRYMPDALERYKEFYKNKNLIGLTYTDSSWSRR